MNTIRRYYLASSTALLIALGSPIATAQEVFYRWLDDRGNPVHSDRPPPSGTDYEVVETGSSLVRRVSGDEGAVPPETTPKVGNEFVPVDMKLERTKPNPEYCQRARENLEALETGAEIAVKNNQGEDRTLSREEVETEKAKARDAIRVHCR